MFETNQSPLKTRKDTTRLAEICVVFYTPFVKAASLLTKLTVFILFLAFASNCGNPPEIERREKLDFETVNNINSDKETFLTILVDTEAKSYTGVSCKLLKNDKLYFSDYQNEYELWEFKLSRPIRNCPLEGWIYIDRDHILLDELPPDPINDSDYGTVQDAPTNSQDYEYISNNGFDDYDGDSFKLEYFPLSRYPIDSYKTGGREFGAARSYGRKHAANDLLMARGQPVFAVTDGEILDYYFFYEGTYAIVVDHGSYVVRYGEVGSMSSNLKKGSKVKAGQQIGTVGQLYSGASMLHFEKYSGKYTGNLTVRKNKPYQRRWDLLRPTEFLDRLVGTYPR